MLFLTTAFSQVVQKHWIGVVGNCIAATDCLHSQ